VSDDLKEPTVEELIELLDDDMIEGGYDRTGLETLLLMARNKLEELATLRALRELLARVPEDYPLSLSGAWPMGSHEASWTDGDGELVCSADHADRYEAIRAATVLLLGVAPETGPALHGDGWQIVQGQEPPGLTCEQYAEIYLGGEW
jgi:hypothetical protein